VIEFKQSKPNEFRDWLINLPKNTPPRPNYLYWRYPVTVSKGTVSYIRAGKCKRVNPKLYDIKTKVEDGNVNRVWVYARMQD
jgi:hypothetical protein